MSTPADWKNYEDFAAGIDTNRLPPTTALAGRKFSLAFDSHSLLLDFESGSALHWSQGGERGDGQYEAVEVAPNTLFIDITFAARLREALTLIVNTASHRVLSVRCIAAEQRIDGQPLVSQRFEVGVLGDARSASGMRPEPTRDLIGLRTLQRYSPQHLYEHVYLSTERYCWQCLVGEQRGHGDVDLATYYKFDEHQYLFTFREFLIPVASVFFFNMQDLRSTGKFLGLTRDGRVQNSKAGAFIRKTSMTFYDQGAEPV